MPSPTAITTTTTTPTTTQSLEGRREGEREEHQRLPGDEPRGERDAVDVLAPRRDLLPHVLDDPADHHRDHREAGDEHAEADGGRRRDEAADAGIRLEESENDADDEGDDERPESALGQGAEPL